MLLSELTKVVNSAVVPVVIISACGLLCLAFYNRMAAIISRLRTFQRERLHERRLLQEADDESFESQQRRKLLDFLELQTLHVTRRAKLIRLTLFFLLLTIGLLIACCLTLGLATLLPTAVYVAVPLFVLGMLSMLCAVAAAACELHKSIEPAELECRFVTTILREEAKMADEV